MWGTNRRTSEVAGACHRLAHINDRSTDDFYIIEMKDAKALLEVPKKASLDKALRSGTGQFGPAELPRNASAAGGRTDQIRRKQTFGM